MTLRALLSKVVAYRPLLVRTGYRRDTSICYFFMDSRAIEQSLSIKLDKDGNIAAELATRSIEDMIALQEQAQTVVVIPTPYCSLFEVALPKLPYQKARAAIPYALDDQLSQPLSGVQVAFDRAHYQDGHYLVAVIDKTVLTGLIEQLSHFGLAFNSITLDWFALRTQESCVSSDYILVNDTAFKGALTRDLVRFFEPPDTQFMASSSDPALCSKTAVPMAMPFQTWIAKRLQQTTPLNVCQGEFEQTYSMQRTRRWYQACLLLLGLWLVSILVVDGIQLRRLNHQLAGLDQNIATIYHAFFPNAKQIISPRFRISQQLKSGANQSVALWPLLGRLADAFQGDSLMIKQLRYQNQRLFVTLSGRHFSELEALQRRLKKAHVQVTQTQASSQHQTDVIATLELRL